MPRFNYVTESHKIYAYCTEALLNAKLLKLRVAAGIAIVEQRWDLGLKLAAICRMIKLYTLVFAIFIIRVHFTSGLVTVQT